MTDTMDNVLYFLVVLLGGMIQPSSSGTLYPAQSQSPYNHRYRSRALTSGYGAGYSQSLPQPASYVTNTYGGYNGNAYSNPYNPYTGGVAPAVSLLRASDTMAYPPFCRCYPPQPVCGSDGISYASICDLVNSMTGLPGLGFRCGTACPCSFNYTEYQALQQRTFRGSFVTCLTNGTTVESPLALQTALIFDQKVGIRNDADCAVGQNGPWRCPNYPTDFPPHMPQSPASRKPMPVPSTPLPPGSVVINLGEGEEPITKARVTTTARPKPAVVINLGSAPTTRRPATTRRTTKAAAPVVVINTGAAGTAKKAPEGESKAAAEGGAPKEEGAPKEGAAAEGEGAAPKEGAAAEGEGGAPKEGAAAEGEGGAPKEGAAAEGEGAAPKEGAAAEGEGGAAAEGEGGAAKEDAPAGEDGAPAAAESGGEKANEAAAKTLEDDEVKITLKSDGHVTVKRSGTMAKTTVRVTSKRHETTHHEAAGPKITPKASAKVEHATTGHTTKKTAKAVA